MKSGRKNSHWLLQGLSWIWDLIWSYRLELGAVGIALGYFWLATTLPLYIGAILWVALVGAAAFDIRRGRVVVNRIAERLGAAKLRRHVITAAEDRNFPGLRIERVAYTLPGEMIDVQVPRGQTVDQLESRSRALAGCLEVTDVRVLHSREDRSRASLSIIRRDPLLTMDASPWPLMDAEQVNIRKGAPFGRDEYGRVIDVRLLSRNMIMGGSPDAGKSAALRILIAAAVLDPLAKVWLMDAKTGAAEFVHWAPAAHRLVRGRDLANAVEVLRELEERVEKRGEEIVRRGEVFVTDDMEIDVLFIDELPQYTRTREDDGKEDVANVKRIRDSIWKLIALGRWTGMPTVLSAQKPTADLVPTEFRDLIDNKFALHCNTKAMSDTILGAGAGEEAPANAASIPSGYPGLGYYVGDHGVVKMRSFFISPKQAMEISSRVASRNIDEEMAAL